MIVKIQKLFQKALASPQNTRFDEFMTLLTAFGFTLERISGSHHIFSHDDVAELLTIQPAKDGKAKPYQLRQFFKIVEQYNLKFTGDIE